MLTMDQTQRIDDTTMTKPNFKIVNPFPAFVTTCYRCAKRLQSDKQTIWADLNGPAFKAYYCEKCRNQSGSTAIDLLIVTVGILSIAALAFTIGALPVLIGFAELAKILNFNF